MVRTPDSLESQLLRLPAADRARLAALLLESLEAAEGSAPPADADAAWAAEAERRLAELREGTVAGIPADEVFARVARRVAG